MHLFQPTWFDLAAVPNTYIVQRRVDLLLRQSLY